MPARRVPPEGGTRGAWREFSPRTEKFPTKGSAEKIAPCHCIPTARKVVHRFTITTRPNEALGFACFLTEYQFAGDSKSTGVPIPAPTPTNGAHHRVEWVPPSTPLFQCAAKSSPMRPAAVPDFRHSNVADGA